MWLDQHDGDNDDPLKSMNESAELSQHLQQLSTYSRFIRFAADFRNEEGFHLPYKKVDIEKKSYIQLSLANAAEFLSRKDYCDNWKSEMHETFCFWDFDEWKLELQKAGFSIHPSSKAYLNKWIADNRWVGKVELFDLELNHVEYPVTTMLLIGMK